METKKQEATTEKLQLKHIVGYLPYELMTNEGSLRGLRNYVGWCGVFKSYAGESNVPISAIKPHLRPLSDLTKEITHNGETFVPSEYLNRYSHIYHLPDDWDSVIFINEHNVKSVPLATIEKLYEWHFAINIPEHLYIDINTL